MSQPAKPDYKGLPYEYLIGLVAIASSSLDHMLRMLLAIARQSDLDLAADRQGLAKGLRRCWRSESEDGAIGQSTEAAGTKWLSEVLDVLNRRDVVIHALWQTDTVDPIVLRGTHLRSQRASPDLPSMRRLVSDLHALINDDRIRVLSQELVTARSNR